MLIHFNMFKALKKHGSFVFFVVFFLNPGHVVDHVVDPIILTSLNGAKLNTVFYIIINIVYHFKNNTNNNVNNNII